MAQSSRDQLNQTTVLSGQTGVGKFHSRGNSVGGNMVINMPGQATQKRSQSVDRNAPSYQQYNQQMIPSQHYNQNTPNAQAN